VITITFAPASALARQAYLQVTCAGPAQRESNAPKRAQIQTNDTQIFGGFDNIFVSLTGTGLGIKAPTASLIAPLVDVPSAQVGISQVFRVRVRFQDSDPGDAIAFRSVGDGPRCRAWPLSKCPAASQHADVRCRASLAHRCHHRAEQQHAWCVPPARAPADAEQCPHLPHRRLPRGGLAYD
jgi:hypothetical protein